jgi:hypothetical protein
MINDNRVSGREMCRAYMFEHQAEDQDATTASETAAATVVTPTNGGYEFETDRRVRSVSFGSALAG